MPALQEHRGALNYVGEISKIQIKHFKEESKDRQVF
jgi:hypothetical protein